MQLKTKLKIPADSPSVKKFFVFLFIAFLSFLIYLIKFLEPNIKAVSNIFSRFFNVLFEIIIWRHIDPTFVALRSDVSSR